MSQISIIRDALAMLKLKHTYIAYASNIIILITDYM